MAESNKTETFFKMCDICKKKVNEPILYGDMISRSNITVHYYCLLLSTNLPQNGKENGGILGFLIADIKKEIKEAEIRHCKYCEEEGASIKCNQCGEYFHLICGSIKYCQTEFVDSFVSYCHEHIQVQNTKEHKDKKTCRICICYMNNFNPINSIMANCCNNGWVHSFCLKQYALQAGYYMKCLWCKDPIFRDQIRRQGIFVPDRDAAWELDKNNFGGLYVNYLNCDAKICLCPYGRKNKKNQYYKKGWQILVCNTCGSFGLHRHCSGQNSSEFTCEDCLKVFNNTILINSIPTYRSLAASCLEINIPFNVSEIQESLNKTLFVPKNTQDLHSSLNNIQEKFIDCSVDSSEQCIKKLIKWNYTQNECESVVLAIVDDPNKNEYNKKDITILKELRCADCEEHPLDKELLLESYKEVMEEMEKEKLMNSAGNEIVVEDSDEESRKTVSDLLTEMRNLSTDIAMPKPI